MGKLERLEDDLRAFVRNTKWMLEEFFQELPTRRRQDYIKAYAGYRSVMEEAMNQKKGQRRRGGGVGGRYCGPGHGRL